MISASTPWAVMCSMVSTSPNDRIPDGGPRPAGCSGERLPVSVFLISRNEETRIATAIRSVRDWAAEVVLVDCGSTDATVRIARELGAKTFHNPWPGYGLQKRFAEARCTARWLFNLDADEEVSEQLAGEMAQLFADGAPARSGYEVFAADVFPHEGAPAPWAGGKWFIRLYDRQRGGFSPSPVHDSVIMEQGAHTGRLRGLLYHRSQSSLRFAVDKMNRYSDMQIADMRARQRRISPWRLLYEFPLMTLKCYFLRRACLYGWWGVIHAVNYGFSRHLRIAKAYEAQLLKKQGGDPPTP